MIFLKKRTVMLTYFHKVHSNDFRNKWLELLLEGMGDAIWSFPSLCCRTGVLPDMKRRLASSAGETWRG